MIVRIYGHDYQLAEQQIRPHFALKELANNKGDATKPQFIIDEKVDLFLDMIEEFRKWFNKPMNISSMFRQESFNASVGGDKNSAHLHGCALDWWMPGHTSEQRRNVTAKWEQLCKKYKVVGSLNYYSSGYHLEIYSDLWYGQEQFQIRDYRGKKGDW